MSTASSVSEGHPDVYYIGTHSSSDEGTRHFFMLRSAYSRYTALNGVKVDHFMVYTSTGTNTRGICGKILCIIPCFGTMVQWTKIPSDRQTDSDKKHAVISPIIKIDFFKGLKRYISASGGMSSLESLEEKEDTKKEYRAQLLERCGQLDEKFLASDNISQDLLREFFNDPKGEINLDEYRDLRVKVGSDFFLKDITIYRDRIYKFVKEGQKKMFEDLSYLNRAIGVNNFYGIDLSRLPPYKELMTECVERYKPNYPYYCTLPELFVGENAPHEYKKYAARIIRDTLHRLKNDKNKRDKYLALLNSPPENTIYERLLKIK